MSPTQELQIPVDYDSALEMLYGRINYEKTSSTTYDAQHFRLDRMRELLVQLDSPHMAYKIVHVAGTKGKGTTATLLYDALRANGLRAGLYTSPHLIRLEERFQFDGCECSPSELIALCQIVLEAAQKVESNGCGRCTFFEITTAMGLLHFARNKAACVVLEVGLGGRLDSTNVCTPILSMITSISLDHQAQLGNTISAIAGEKAGIIKPGIPVISTARHLDARRVIQEVAQHQGARLMLIERDFSVEWSTLMLVNCDQAESNSVENPSETDSVAAVEFTRLNCSPASRFAKSTWHTRMLGRHQADNIAGVVTALQWLAEDAGWELDVELSRRAIASSHPVARLERVGNKPIRILDTAHNPVSIAAGLQALDDHYQCLPRIIVFACSRDKDYRSMLKNILPHCHHLICTSFRNNPRAVPGSSLVEVAHELLAQSHGIAASRPQVEVVESSEFAWRRALEVCPSNGLVIAMGSFFLAAELLSKLQRETGE